LQYCIWLGQKLAEIKSLRQFFAVKKFLEKEYPDKYLRQLNSLHCYLHTWDRCYDF
jgi:hypothetical protein